MLLTDYIKRYGKIAIIEKDKSFFCNGTNAIGGKLTARDFKRKGLF